MIYATHFKAICNNPIVLNVSKQNVVDYIYSSSLNCLLTVFTYAMKLELLAPAKGNIIWIRSCLAIISVQLNHVFPCPIHVSTSGIFPVPGLVANDTTMHKTHIFVLININVSWKMQPLPFIQLPRCNIQISMWNNPISRWMQVMLTDECVQLPAAA